jgi:sphingolipid delta-4 desaturase
MKQQKPKKKTPASTDTAAVPPHLDFQKDTKLDHFFWDNQDEPHATRRKEMLKKYPQIRQLMRHEPLTKYIVVVEVFLQMYLAYYLKDSLWTPQFWLTAYFVGGTLTSSLVLSIHEITHFLAFKSFLMNKMLACFANLPIVLPFCVEFKVSIFASLIQVIGAGVQQQTLKFFIEFGSNKT